MRRFVHHAVRQAGPSGSDHVLFAHLLLLQDVPGRRKA